MGFLDDVQGFFKKFTTRASASHILIKGGAEAANKLEDLKAEIGESPVAFAKAASQYSECPSSSRGGEVVPVDLWHLKRTWCRQPFCTMWIIISGSRHAMGAPGSERHVGHTV